MSSELATLVPVEIWEHIIDFVNTISTRRFDPVRCRTLASCCLTSRSWLPRSRLHLYHSVSLYLTPQYQNHSSFLRGLSLNPTNGPLVQWLMVKTEDPNVLESSAGSGLSLIALQLPHRLPNLQFLTLAGVDLINIHPTTYIGLSCFRSVRFLVLQASVWSRYDQIYRVIKAFSGLIEVIIDFPPSHIVQSPTPFVEWTPERRWHNRKITVPSLTLQIPDKYIAGMMHLFAPCTVLNIELRNLLPPEMLAVANYLRLCGKALRKLTLNFKSKAGPVAMHTMVHNVPSMLNLSANKHLQFITISYVPLRAQPDEPDINAISIFLASITSEHLEVLRVHIKYLGNDLPSICKDPGTWGAIDRSLTSSAFLNVKKVHFGISSFAMSRHEELSERSLALLFPGLAKKQTTDFSPFWPGRKRVELNNSESLGGSS